MYCLMNKPTVKIHQPLKLLARTRTLHSNENIVTTTKQVFFIVFLLQVKLNTLLEYCSTVATTVKSNKFQGLQEVEIPFQVQFSLTFTKKEKKKKPAYCTCIP